MASRHDPRGHPLSAWEVTDNFNFAPYVLGNFLSNCSTWFQNIA